MQGTDGFERVFAALTKERPNALYVAGGPLMGANRKRIADFALHSRIPSVYEWREAVVDGGLMSYGPSNAAISGRAATCAAGWDSDSRPCISSYPPPRSWSILPLV